MNFRKAILFAAAAAATAALASTASAQDAAPTITFNVGGSNDYIFRGVSQTTGDMQVFGGVDAALGSLYAGAWASNVDFGDSTDAEVDFYAGFTPTAGPLSLDLGVIYYTYHGDPSGSDYNNFEFKAAGSMAAGPATVGAAVFYSPDSFGAADDATYFEVNGSLPLTEQISLGGALGRQTYKGPGDYTTWNAGLTWTFLPQLAADLRYYDNNIGGAGKAYDETVVLALKATFP